LGKLERYFVFYDGDGGGFGSHIRNLTYIEYLSWITGIPVLNAYPVLDLYFDHQYKRPDVGSININNSMLIEDIFPRKDGALYGYEELRLGLWSLTRDVKYILCGRGGGPPFIQNIARLRSLNRLHIIQLLKDRLGNARVEIGWDRIQQSGLRFG
jgi:hypothetical protein